MRTHYVYRALDADGQALYVGMTMHPRKRHHDHQCKAWAAEVSKWVFRGPYSEHDAANLESDLIRNLNPVHNIRRPARRPDPKPMPTDLSGWRVRLYLDHHGLTADDLATRSGVPLDIINRLCVGELKALPQPQLDAILRVFDAPLVSILDWEAAA